MSAKLRQKIEAKLTATLAQHQELLKKYDLEERCHHYYDDNNPTKRCHLNRIAEDIEKVVQDIAFYRELLQDCQEIT